MWCAERAALALLLSCGCTLANRIDTCDAPREGDVQVNVTGSGDQFTQVARSLVRLPTGRYVAAWVSEPSAKPDSPSHLMATLVTSEGTTLGCGRPNHEVQVSMASDEVVGRFAVAVSPADGSAVYFAWRATKVGSGGLGGRIFARLLRQDLCDFSASPEVLPVSEPAEDAAAPSVAVRSDGREALVAWLALPGPPWLFRVRSRPVGVVTNAYGAVERNACDPLESACVHSHVALAAPPALTAFGDGYALVWAQSRNTLLEGFEVKLQLLSPAGRPRSDGTGARPYGPVDSVDLAAVATADEVLVAHAGQPRAEAPNSLDAEVFLERFSADGGSSGPPSRVNERTDGNQVQPALAVAEDGAVFVAWSTEKLEGQNGLWGRVLDARGRPRFSGLACDTTDFRLSSGSGERQVGVSVVAGGGTLGALFTNETPEGAGGDVDGQSVHLRRFELEQLFPSPR